MIRPLLAAAILLSACASEYPEVGKGGSISGKIHYHGSALGSMTRPALRASASIAFPPVGQPNAIMIVDQPDLMATLPGDGLTYELLWLKPYHYKVTAQIVDLDQPNQDYSMLPLGGFPDYCTLPRDNEGLVNVTKTTPTEGTDFTIYDLAGTSDPCTENLCPQSGKATMRVVVKSSRKAAPNDRLRVALFQSLPADLPSSLRIVIGADLSFPTVVTDNTLPPGRYVFANACLDIGGDSGTGRCTDEDVEVSYSAPQAPIEFPADRIVNLTADLDAKTFTFDGVEFPSGRDCPNSHP